MSQHLVTWLGLGTLAMAVLVAGCESDGSSKREGPTAMGPPFGGPADMGRASSLWSAMSGYRSWATYPGKEGWQDGKSPHGKYLKYYINSVAASNPGTPGNGAIIVKENYMARASGSLGAITVMQKIQGYDPEDGDWFWVKFDPKGNVMKNPKGMSLAGRVAKGMPQGCIACHGNAAGNDFLFVNDE